MNALEFHYLGPGNIRTTLRILRLIILSSYLVLKKSWKIIFNYLFLFSLTTNILFFTKESFSQEKFEGIIVSINSEIITTYDLSQRIKLALKSLKLEDNINI